jgi:hypothetical protein
MKALGFIYIIVMPQVFIKVFNSNDRVKLVDFGQATVNLGHHLENTTKYQQPLMVNLCLCFSQWLVKFV